MGQAQNLTKGQDGLGQPVKIRDGMQDGTVPDFDSMSLPIPRKEMGRSRKGLSKIGKGCSKTEKGVLKQEKMVLNRKIMF